MKKKIKWKDPMSLSELIAFAKQGAAKKLVITNVTDSGITDKEYKKLMKSLYPKKK